MRTDFESSILDLMVEMRRICGKCGKFCSRLIIPLTEIETPIITRALGSYERVYHYIRQNPYPFNVQSEYYFYAEDECPFLRNNRCSIYPRRPLPCMLFPFRLMAFIDKDGNVTREPVYDMASGHSDYPCMQANILLFGRIQNMIEDYGPTASRLIDYVFAATLDDVSFGYLYLQQSKRGPRSFNVAERNENIPEEFLTQLTNLYHNSCLLNTPVEKRLTRLSDAMISRIRGRKEIREATELASNLVKKISSTRSDIIDWRLLIRTGKE